LAREGVTAFQKSYLTVAARKMHICATASKLQGICSVTEGVTASPDKVKAVRQCPVPRNVKEVRLHLGLPSFYRIAKPLTQMIRKKFQVKWESNQQAA
jgi:hypothetical protein